MGQKLLPLRSGSTVPIALDLQDVAEVEEPGPRGGAAGA
jgi:hypothetical protein